MDQSKHKTYQVRVYRRGQVTLTQIAKFSVPARNREEALQEGWLQLFLKAEPERSQGNQN